VKSKNKFFSFKNQCSKLAKCTVALDNYIPVNLRQSSSQLGKQLYIRYTDGDNTDRKE